MSSNDTRQHIINHNASLIEALEKLNNLPGNEMTLFVEDDDHRIIGTLTDGDIRRSLLAGLGTDSDVFRATHRDFRRLRRGNIDLDMIRSCRERGINVLPVLDSEDRLTDIINLNVRHTILPVSAILMAGGKGERLRPMTLDTPKPLL